MGPALQVLATMCDDQPVWEVLSDARAEMAVVKHASSSDPSIAQPALRCLIALAQSSDRRSREVDAPLLPRVLPAVLAPAGATCLVAEAACLARCFVLSGVLMPCS